MCLIPLKIHENLTEDRRPKPSLSRSTHGLLRSPLPYWIIDLTGLEQSDMQRKNRDPTLLDPAVDLMASHAPLIPSHLSRLSIRSILVFGVMYP